MLASAEAMLLDSAKRLALPVTLVRKPRSVGIVPQQATIYEVGYIRPCANACFHSYGARTLLPPAHMRARSHASTPIRPHTKACAQVLEDTSALLIATAKEVHPRRPCKPMRTRACRCWRTLR